MIAYKVQKKVAWKENEGSGKTMPDWQKSEVG